MVGAWVLELWAWHLWDCISPKAALTSLLVILLEQSPDRICPQGKHRAAQGTASLPALHILAWNRPWKAHRASMCVSVTSTNCNSKALKWVEMNKNEGANPGAQLAAAVAQGAGAASLFVTSCLLSSGTPGMPGTHVNVWIYLHILVWVSWFSLLLLQPQVGSPFWGEVLAELLLVQRVLSAPGLWPQMFPWRCSWVGEQKAFWLKGTFTIAQQACQNILHYVIWSTVQPFGSTVVSLGKFCKQ